MYRTITIMVLIAVAVILVFVADATMPGMSPPLSTEELTDEIMEVFAEPPLTSRELCQANTIIAGSLVACQKHPNCGLSNEETFTMYTASKDAAIQCRKADMVEKYAKDYVEELLKKEPPVPKSNMLPQPNDQGEIAI